MKKSFIVFLVTVIPAWICATIYQVGPTRTYKSPNQLYNANVIADGDVIEIDFATYTGTETLAYWNKNNLTIRGVGGRPKLQAAGAYIFGKGIWVTAGTNMEIDNIEFSDAKCPDKNGAGIRMDSGSLTVKNSFFHHNENGILTNAAVDYLTVEFSEFGYNGYGDGYSHNIYVGNIGNFTFRYNYSHHAIIGHQVKSRAKNNYILYNRIMDESTGNSSRLVDLPNGGFSVVMGNLFMKGPLAENSNSFGYGLEGLTNSVNELYVINNTFINKRTASGIFLAIQNGTTVSKVSNNIFAGIGSLFQGTPSQSNNNISNTNISYFKIADELNYDYRILSGSPAIDAGAAAGSAGSLSLLADREYVHPQNFTVRSVVGTIDVGAYEYRDSSLDASSQPEHQVKIYPNPTSGIIMLQNLKNVSSLQIFDLSGKIVFETDNTVPIINISKYKEGLYLLKVMSDNTSYTFKIIKK